LSAVTTADTADLERFFTASIRNVERLRHCQRHTEAERVLCGLRRLVNTVRAQAPAHGYLADIVLNDWPERIEHDQFGGATESASALP
jgi:hypothetical protein